MKKLLWAIFMATILFTGCGSDTKDEMNQAVASAENTDVKTVYDTVSALSSGNLAVLDDNMISNYYGVDTSRLKDYVFAQSDDPTSAAMIIIALPNDGEDVSEYEDNIKNILSQKTDEMTNYDQPEQVELLNNAETLFNDKGFYVVVSDNAAAIAETISKDLGF